MPPSLGAGRSLDRRLPAHRVVRRIARGEQTEVLLAEPIEAPAPGEARWFALKRLRPELIGDDEATAALRREIEMAGRLRHPRLPRPLERRIEGRSPWMTMEYVDGPDLGRLLLELGRRGRLLELPAALVVVTGLIDALRYLHRDAGAQLGGPAQGLPVLHGALTPQNVLIGTNGDVRLTDLGRAWFAGRQPPKVPTTRIRMDSLSPEALRDQPLTERTDVFHLGTLLYEVLSGRHPFLMDSVQATAREVGLTQPLPVAKLRPELPGELSDLVSRCIHLDPEARPRTVGEVGRALSAMPIPGAGEGPRALVRELVSVFPEHNDASRPWVLRGGSYHPPFLPMVLSWLPPPPVIYESPTGTGPLPVVEPPWEPDAQLEAIPPDLVTDRTPALDLRPLAPPPTSAPATPAPAGPEATEAEPPAVPDPPRPRWSSGAVGAGLGALGTALLFALFVPRTPTISEPPPPLPSTGLSGEPQVVRGDAASRDETLPTLEGAGGEEAELFVPLIVITEPQGAEVFIDGVSAGASPVTVRRQPGALLQVQAHTPGLAPVARLYAVPAGGGSLTLTLDPAP
ncbi:MAG: serine/threonine protein kinase [Deltaproteobacteria bacterium]|nr:serine/threonine protein kinase [Deltaproteobacteria bacterium]